MPSRLWEACQNHSAVLDFPLSLSLRLGRQYTVAFCDPRWLVCIRTETAIGKREIQSQSNMSAFQIRRDTFTVCSLSLSPGIHWKYLHTTNRTCKWRRFRGLAFAMTDGIAKTLPMAVWIYTYNIPLLPAVGIFNWKH